MAASTSTKDALTKLCADILDWNSRLDGLNGQIAQRQTELARLMEDRPPTARSVRNKGSTESLRPKDGDENPFGNSDDIPMNPFESPRSMQNGFHSTQRPSPATRAAVVTPPNPPQAIPNPKASPSALNRQSSHPTPNTKPRISPAVLRKRKTESLASGESIAPKYRTRSMIIVYYDSAVQTAFEELVKSVSLSRSTMRKGKMAAKMSEMRRAAELEVEGEEDDGGSFGDLLPSAPGMGAWSAQQSNLPVPTPAIAGDEFEADTETEPPKLRFISTRQMGPPKDYSRGTENMSSALSLDLMKGYRRSGAGTADIFDQLDKGLEWCQSQLERAAHQFLRDGECNNEIENIKMKLGEITDAAEKDLKRQEQEETSNPQKATGRNGPAEIRSRGLKHIQMRREIGSPKALEVDGGGRMEVDDEDEGVDDMDQPPLVFKRSRDIGR